jgi:TRAP-type C4-dicarboxylate transport system permease small subunit
MTCERGAARIDRIIDVLLALMLATMALAVFYRWSGATSSVGRPRGPRNSFLLLFVTMLGGVSALLSVTMLFDSASGRHRLFWLRDIALGAVLIGATWQGIAFAELNATQASPAFEIPMAIPYVALPLPA